jgi:hypothetical protein
MKKKSFRKMTLNFFLPSLTVGKNKLVCFFPLDFLDLIINTINRKNLLRTNDLAYFDLLSVTKKKHFITLTLSVKVTKLFYSSMMA